MKSILAAAAIVLLQICQVAPAAAQQGFVWNYYRYLDPDPFQTSLTLVYGIPETDAYQFSAQCEIGAGGTYAYIEIGANVGNLPNGTMVDIQFTGAGFNRVVIGEVVGQFAEVGITGVSFAVEMNDPIWQALRGLSQLYYNITGFTALSLSLQGSSGPVSGFVNDCITMPGPGTPAANPPPVQNGKPGAAGPGPVLPAGGQMLSCNDIGQIRSVGGGPATTVIFVNNSDGYRTLFWLDFNGTPVQYASLNPGESYSQETAVGHPWMITDGPGNCLEVYSPAPGQSVFSITAPGRYFGPE